MSQTPNPAIIFVAVLASLLEIIDTSIVNVAIPTMMGNLGATLEDISMVVTSYAIANAIVLPASAWLSERLGRRRYFLGCIVAFTLASVACGLAPNLVSLIIFRIFQGLAGGALLPTSQAFIYEQFPKEKAGMAGAIFGMSIMVGPTLGPVLGGYLTDQFGWRSIFYINFPLGLLALMIGLSVIFDREQTPKQSKSLDWTGLLFLILGIGCLQFVLERGEASDWFSSKVISINAIISAICIPLFVWWELRVENPIINVRLFKLSLVRNGVFLLGIVGFFLYAVVFIYPVLLSVIFHYEATKIGEMFIPSSILTIIMLPFVGKKLQRGTNPKIMIAIGFISVEIFLYFSARLSTLSSEREILNVLYLRGFGLAFLFVPINSSILSQFRGATLDQVSGLLNLFRQVGGSFGIALVATLLSKYTHQHYTNIVSHISLLNPITQSTFTQTMGALSQKMLINIGMASSHDAVYKVFYLRIINQVFMLSFIQMVWILFFIIALVFIPLLKIKMKPPSSTTELPIENKD